VHDGTGLLIEKESLREFHDALHEVLAGYWGLSLFIDPFVTAGPTCPVGFFVLALS
jgi:hypothetical protein